MANRRFSSLDDDDDDDEKPKKQPVKGKGGKKRRSVLKTIGLSVTGLVGVTLAGATARGLQTGAIGDLTAGAAFTPWRQWQSRVGTAPADGEASGAKPLPRESEPDPAGILEAGILAASPHNSQPWKFAVNGNIVDLMIDQERWLGAIDPFRREMLIGMGCCLENLLVGAKAIGMSPLLNMFPDGFNGDRIARITMYRAAQEITPAAVAIGARRTNRGAYRRDRPVDLKTISKLEEELASETTRLFWFDAEKDSGQNFAKATLAATEAFVADSELASASDKWFRHDLATTNRRADGVATLNAGLSRLMTRAALMAPKNMIGDIHQQWLKSTREVQLPTAPMFGMILAPSIEDRVGLVEAGRLWQRMHLKATALGLSMQPMNQVMEMADAARARSTGGEAIETVAKMTNFDTYTGVFGFRVGYSDEVPFPSPRRNVALAMGLSGR